MLNEEYKISGRKSFKRRRPNIRPLQTLEEKPIELKISSGSSPVHVVNAKIFTPWCEEIDKATNGRLKITLYPGGALAKSKENFDAALKGICDISYGWISYNPERHPLSEIYYLPGAVRRVY